MNFLVQASKHNPKLTTKPIFHLEMEGYKCKQLLIDLKVCHKMRNLVQLEIDAGGVAGARERFQNLVAHIVRFKHKKAVEVLAGSGDWGIDVLHGTLTTGSCLVWQAKYFMDGIRISERSQIDQSFQQLVKKSKEKSFRVDGWELCVPCILSTDAIAWWEKWNKKNTADTGIAIGLMCLTDIEEFLMIPQARYILRAFNLDERPDENVGERHVVNLPDGKAAEYDSSLFIRKLIAAGIVENMAAREQFFNAEIMHREIHDKGDPDEIEELDRLEKKIWSMWEPRFNAAIKSDNPERETRKVCFDLQLAIERMDKGTLDSPMVLASLVHKLGVMHQLADVCKVGWSPNFHEIAQES
jgi:hypothetical protein